MGNMEFLLELMVLLVLMTTAASGLRADDFSGAVVYLKKYGYLNAPPPSEGRRPPPQEMKAALRVFQKATQLQVSGRVDAATLRMMRKPRCGEEDSFRFHRYRVLGHWRKKMLTYRILNFTPHLGQGKTRQAISAAFRYWSDVSPLKFRETQTGRADIKISFHRKDKSCPVPFDGRGQVLAHADAPESGMVHFDSDEVWTEGKSSGSNLRIVAAHEVGHALGLGHSQHYSAVMGPVYSGYRAHFKLHPDDIQGIQALYGKPEKPPPKKSPSAPGVAPDPCGSPVDAVMLGPQQKTFVFKGGFVWTVSRSGLDPPRLTSDLWRELPGGLSAAVTSQRSGKTYFLKENRVWRYSGFKLDHGFPRKLSNIPANIDAAFYLSKSKKLIFIKGSGYWQWDETSTSGFSSYPRPLSHLFPGAPGAPDAALASSDGNILLFKGSQVWSVKLQKRVEKPRSLAADWLKCDD
ncbi:matrix metalloproteinase-19-like [Trematomus bernacchii]|uniref:matrix metalloproteinase-19-like n=1 Tax=Trematomus bernacchii TaxID=40690 RepID=UPI00146D01BF|nr:matrix metalloproteinase-19-like [Trematomus bernacchii]